MGCIHPLFLKSFLFNAPKNMESEMKKNSSNMPFIPNTNNINSDPPTTR